MRNIFDLSGKVTAVIGGASGIGEAVTIGASALAYFGLLAARTPGVTNGR